MDPLDARQTSRSTFEGAPSFPVGNRVERALWAVVWALLASWTPPQMRRWRNLLLRMFGAKLHRGAMVYGSARVWLPRNLVMEDGAALGPGAICYNMAPVTLGYRATVSQRAHLCAGTHAIDDPTFQLYARPVLVGAHAWVAAEAFVGPGVTVGEGAVLGARGVATKDLAPWMVHAGNPARQIRERSWKNEPGQAA